MQREIKAIDTLFCSYRAETITELYWLVILAIRLYIVKIRIIFFSIGCLAYYSTPQPHDFGILFFNLFFQLVYYFFQLQILVLKFQSPSYVKIDLIHICFHT